MNFNKFLLHYFILPSFNILFSNSFYTILKKIRKLDKLSKEQIEKIHKNRLHTILHFAAHQVPFYIEYFKFKNKNYTYQLSDFPIIDKLTLQQYGDKFLTKPKKTLLKQHSSGSTGQKTTTYWSKSEQALYRAIQIRWWEWAGYKIGDPILQTGIQPNRTFIKKCKDFLLNTYYLNAFHHSPNNLLKALNWAKNQKQPVLAGYASSLYILAQFAKKNDLNINFKTAISWGDQLFPHYRKKIEKVFKCSVFNTYACAEGIMIAAQKDSDNLNIMSPFTHVEILNEQLQSVNNNSIGNIITTNLCTFSMPLIRYKTGDFGSFHISQNHNFTHSKLSQLIGRNTDIIVSSNNVQYNIHSFTGIFENLDFISQFYIEQHHINEIIIYCVPQTFITNTHLKLMENTIRKKTKYQDSIQFKIIDSIPKLQSGKPQIIRSFLNQK